MSAWLIVLVFVGLTAVIEGLVRLRLRIRGEVFDPPPRGKLYVGPHPFLTYALLPSIATDNPEPARYSLHKGEYEFRTLRTNAYRCVGDEIGPKEAGAIRVLCLGHSTVATSVWEVGGAIEYSLPLELARYLRQTSPDRRFEVVNGAVGGWTTAELLTAFALNLIDLQPDIVVLYNAYNDLTPSLTPGFRSDYSHSRRNLGERFWKIRLAARLPEMPWWKSYSYAAMRLVGSGNTRHDVHANIGISQPDWEGSFNGLATEMRNVESLAHLCRGNTATLIVSTFAYYLYAGAENDPIKVKLRDGVLEENDALRSLAVRHGLPLVDIARELPLGQDMFLDTVHLTPLGMKHIARRLGEAVLIAAR